MKTLLIWVMINLSNRQLANHLQFPTQSDCLHGISQLNQAGKFNRQYKCVSMKVVDPLAYGSYGSYSQPTSPDQVMLERDAAARQQQQGQRNGEYNLRKLQSYEITK